MIGAGKMGAARHSESRARAIVSRGSALLVAVFLLLAAAWAQSPPAKVVGTIKSVTGSSAVVTTDSGSEMTVTLSESARVVRTQPGQTDLKSASPIAVSEIEVGDRVFVRGQSGEGGALIASSVVVMKKGEIAEPSCSPVLHYRQPSPSPSGFRRAQAFAAIFQTRPSMRMPGRAGSTKSSQETGSKVAGRRTQTAWNSTFRRSFRGHLEMLLELWCPRMQQTATLQSWT